MAKQVENGKSFEYSLATVYYEYLMKNRQNVVILDNENYNQAREYFARQSDNSRKSFLIAANRTIDTLVRIEPGLTNQANPNDQLIIKMMPDKAGESGDVRDVIFQRQNWEIGFSAKNNNDAVKHSRLSPLIDFGKIWLNHTCSKTYWNEINPIFSDIHSQKIDNPQKTWAELGSYKAHNIYIPLLNAFQKEMLYLNHKYEDIPYQLINYLIGNHAFYKVIKEDSNNLVVVKAFNLNGGLNKPYQKQQPKAKIPLITFPHRIIEFAFKQDSDNTLEMILDEGWSISFRIHSASTLLESSLKFDVKLTGNPPILFSQHLFSE